jgi:hypothetical protein
MEYLDYILDAAIILGSLMFGLIAGLVIGHRQGWNGATSYYQGYRHEDGEINKRLRARVSVLETTLKEAIEMLREES